ncbi:MAG: tetratricopeptide repeat protein [Candidatus Taylorbacteria bacterium]|nr:tetratricopeptide repeat protein [Candidatus Taylorbacteria bacterium]
MNKIFDSILKYVTLGAIVGVLLVPFVKYDLLFFPFITGKAIAFRTFVGIGLISYLGLILRDKSYLPKKNIVLWSTVIFTIILGIATLNSVNPYRSFWSNFERMEGYVTILYLFAFFIITSSVVKTKQAWYALLSISLAASVAVGLSGFADYNNSEASVVRIAGWLGNSTYLGIYALLHAFLAIFLISKLSYSKFKDQIILYVVLGAVSLFNLVVMYNTGTRGSVVGLGVAVLIGSALIAIYEKNNQALRKSALGLLVFFVVVIGILGFTKNTEFVKNSPLLYRFASLITTDISSVLENQGRSRTLLWDIAKEGVAEKPLLGWGQENFSYVFGKYYNPNIYDQEQWFDRTHNVFLDWMISGGILGLLGYLLLFVSALVLIWKRKKDSDWSVFEKSLVTALLVAYFVHNIFVFDNLTSYIIFFFLLAYVTHENVDDDRKSEPSIVRDDLVTGIAVLFIAIIVGFATYHTAYKPYRVSRILIDGLISFQPGAESMLGKRATTYEGRLSYFKDALSYNTFAKTEIIERLADVTPQLIAGVKDKNVIEQYVTVVDENYRQIIADTAGDHRAPLLYGVFLQKVGLLNQSLEYINQAEKVAPKKQSLLYQKGLTLIMMGKTAEAVEVYKQALALAPQNKDAKVYLGIAYMYDKKLNEAKKVFGDDLEILSDPKVIQSADSLGLHDFVIEIAKKKIAAEPNNPQYHVSLAAAYLNNGQRQLAIEEIRKAIEIEPAFKEQGETYIKLIQEGKTPTQ